MAREYVIRFGSDDRGRDVGLFMEKIVRCKDCKHCGTNLIGNAFCTHYNHAVNPDDFCRYAGINYRNTIRRTEL